MLRYQQQPSICARETAGRGGTSHHMDAGGAPAAASTALLVVPETETDGRASSASDGPLIWHGDQR
jgi:hypothetical protein